MGFREGTRRDAVRSGTHTAPQGSDDVQGNHQQRTVHVEIKIANHGTHAGARWNVFKYILF